MTIFRLTAKANADLIGIAKYTEQKWGRKQRNIYLKQLDNAFRWLTKNPMAGIGCDYIRKGYRKYLEGKHLIFYRIVARQTSIEIIRVLHQSMDVERHFE